MTSPRRELTFASTHHDRAVDHRRDPTWLDAAWSAPESRVLVVSGDQIEVGGAGGPLWHPAEDAPPAGSTVWLTWPSDTGLILPE